MAVTKDNYSVDLSSLHAIYERNYIKIMRLLPDIRQTGYQHRIAFTSDQNSRITLCFNTVENSPYTSYIELTQDPLLAWLPTPSFYIRCYHDAKLAEITYALNTRNFEGVYSYPNPKMHQPDEKQQLNSFLSEWLNQCLASGYEIKPIALVI